jgi:hypothetical protein
LEQTNKIFVAILLLYGTENTKLRERSSPAGRGMPG